VVDGVTFSADGKTLIKYPNDKVDEEYVVPEGTEIIMSYAIDMNEHLRKITLPSSLMKMGFQAIKSCSCLEIVVFNTYPQQIVSPIFVNNPIKEFQTLETCINCIAIDGVLFSSDKKVLLHFPTYNSLEPKNKYIVPEGTETISERAFGEAYVNELILPSTLREIEDYAFSRCQAISVTWKHFPDNRGLGIFTGTKISSFNVIGDDCNCVSIDGVLYSKDNKRLLLVPACKIYDRIPEGVKEIGTKVMGGADIEKMILPTTLTHINDSAFYDNISYHFSLVVTGKFPILGKHTFYDKGVSIIADDDNPYCHTSEDGSVYSNDGKILHFAPRDFLQYFYCCVEIIDRYAFQDTYFRYGDIYIPGSVRLIREHAFDDVKPNLPTCSETSYYDFEFTCDALTPPELEGEVFTEDNVGNSTLLVPKGSEELYKATPQWNTFGAIKTPRPPQGILESSVSSLKVNRVDGAICIEALKPLETVRLINLNGNIVHEKNQVNSCYTVCDISSLDGFFGLLHVIYKDGDSEVIKLNF
jgi:hypothetical protein